MPGTSSQRVIRAHSSSTLGDPFPHSQRSSSRTRWRSQATALPAQSVGWECGSIAAPSEPAKSGILITGSEGLIGSALASALSARGENIIRLDLRAPEQQGRGDVRCQETVRRALLSCRGVVHLAAVSRVALGERDPDLCWSTNVGGTRAVVDAALALSRRPWLLFASSREVYGQPRELPATEETPLAPVNVYGRSKVAGERLVDDATSHGLRAVIVRFSNVYGSTRDHRDRVVPAFARAALLGHPLLVEGRDHTFDFTHIDDVVRGLVSTIQLLDGGESLPSINLLTGTPSTLWGLAHLSVELAGTAAPIIEVPPRSFDVSHFYGNPTRARAILGWNPSTTLRQGVAGLICDFRTELCPTGTEVRA